ncbi:ORCT-like protein [Mya arenaria]|uniref:ORCT-like protein n=1 Tax=Mya arenaria TaxID=6604 RepID=A0ABY7EM16_MYAAR|nr:ORCT-like protein [Mya arenaria]
MHFSLVDITPYSKCPPIAYTCWAPAWAANMDRIPVPHPTSSTILSRNTSLFLYIQSRRASYWFVVKETRSLVSMATRGTSPPFIVCVGWETPVVLVAMATGGAGNEDSSRSSISPNVFQGKSLALYNTDPKGDKRCVLPGWENDTYAIQSPAHLAAINQTIPTTDDKHQYEQCNFWVADADGNEHQEQCSQWVYDKSVFTSTLAADLDMVCGRAIMKSNAQMIFFFGLLAGSFLTGLASDRFGRKRTMMVSTTIYVLAATVIAWTPSYVVYVLLTFSVGFFAVGNFMPVFVIGMEFVGPPYRRIAGVVSGFEWAAGNIILAGLGYLIRDWKTLQLACALPGVLFQLWSAAKWNKRELPAGFFNKVFKETPPTKTERIWHLFTNRALRIRTLTIFFCWYVCLSYYGLALNIGNIGGDMFLNFFLQALMDIPATIITLVLLDRTGRKPLQVASFLIGGVGCLATMFTIMYGKEDYQTVTTVLAMLGKVGASMGFSMVYVYSAELFPTVVRNAGMGSCSAVARVGGMLAPFIADLNRLVGGSFGPALPQLVFGSLTVVGGFLSLLLPETCNRRLPETIQEAIDFGKCALPGWENDTYAIQSPAHLAAVNQTIPTTDDKHQYDQCNFWVTDADGNEHKEQCSQWVYDKSVFTSTLAADLDMVCGRAIMKSNAQMIFFFGLLAGSFLTGLASDSDCDRVDARLRRLCSTYVRRWLLCRMEFVGPPYRKVAGIVSGFHWVAGNVILAGLGYLIRDWKTLQLACALPGVLFQLWWKFYPESPRWLYTRGRLSECESIIRSAAKWNKRELPAGFFGKVFQETPTMTSERIWHLFTNRTLCIRTLTVFFCWYGYCELSHTHAHQKLDDDIADVKALIMFAVCLSYYGLALNSGDIGGDMFLNFFLQALMDLPATAITLVLLDRTGRKPLQVASFFIGGTGCLATMFTIVYGKEAYQTATTVLAMLGKVGASMGFSMVYVYSAELFPTVVRNAGMGSCSAVARVGGMLAPLIADLDRLVGGSFGQALPQLVFGSLTLVAGFLTLFLPETCNRRLPETIEEAITFGNKPDDTVETGVDISVSEKEKEVYENKAFEDSSLNTKL